MFDHSLTHMYDIIYEILLCVPVSLLNQNVYFCGLRSFHVSDTKHRQLQFCYWYMKCVIIYLIYYLIYLCINYKNLMEI